MAKYRVGLGVSGGIAAYKAVEVMRLLQKSGCEVSVASGDESPREGRADCICALVIVTGDMRSALAASERMPIEL